MSHRVLVLLDLEETVIDDWEQRNLLLGNIAKINDLLRWMSIDSDLTIGLMSWAVWDDKDKSNVLEKLLPVLNEVLAEPMSPKFVLSMQDWGDLVLSHCKLKLTRDDMFDMFRKEEVLFSLRTSSFLNQFNAVFLIDDAVTHQTTFGVDGKTQFGILNVKEM